MRDRTAAVVLRARVLLVAYLVVVAALTVAPLVEPWVLSTLVRLVGEISGQRGHRTGVWVERGSNVALFVPLALLLCWALPRVPRTAVWLGCVLVSAAVELVQWAFLPDRTASAVDVVTNAAGAAVGVGLHWLLTRRR
ncbi:VanZ family protein [Modestobacter sp. NPDC049651]|uniref:VanZ family protein n=1 Tax=unclassified Modestobacter TaxID=2643866 RepID=UPI003400D2DF